MVLVEFLKQVHFINYSTSSWKIEDVIDIPIVNCDGTMRIPVGVYKDEIQMLIFPSAGCANTILGYDIKKYLDSGLKYSGYSWKTEAPRYFKMQNKTQMEVFNIINALKT